MFMPVINNNRKKKHVKKRDIYKIAKYIFLIFVKFSEFFDAKL